jgi:hypothetical protein
MEDYEKANTLLDKVLAIDPNNIDALDIKRSSIDAMTK